VDPVPDPLLLRKSGSAGNRTQDLWICRQKLWPLDQWYSTFFVPVFPDTISLQLCTPKLVGV
jgi:hypothetical protein